MNKRQLKKKVKAAKFKKERGLILSLEDRHFSGTMGNAISPKERRKAFSFNGMKLQLWLKELLMG